jgi:hypothetical protein
MKKMLIKDMGALHSNFEALPLKNKTGASSASASGEIKPHFPLSKKGKINTEIQIFHTVYLSKNSYVGQICIVIPLFKDLTLVYPKTLLAHTQIICFLLRFFSFRIKKYNSSSPLFGCGARNHFLWSGSTNRARIFLIIKINRCAKISF